MPPARATAPAQPPGAPAASVPLQGAPQGASASPATARAALPGTAILGSAAAIERSRRIALDVGRETVVDPAASFEVELSSGSSDARIVLLDGRDALVAANSSREVGAARTRLTLAPAAPLTPGSRYLLRVDGAATRELHDSAGRAYEPIAHPLLAAGSPPPPPEPKEKPARRRRR